MRRIPTTRTQLCLLIVLLGIAQGTYAQTIKLRAYVSLQHRRGCAGVWPDRFRERALGEYKPLGRGLTRIYADLRVNPRESAAKLFLLRFDWQEISCAIGDAEGWLLRWFELSLACCFFQFLRFSK